MDDAGVATPRQDVVEVPPEVLQEAQKLAEAKKYRDAVVLVLNAHRDNAKCTPADYPQTGLPALLADAGGVVFACLTRLRSDPWAMLSLDESVDGDAEVKRAYRRLALQLHPDKARWGSTDLFACLHAAYERLGTAAARADFTTAREEEAAARAAARAAGPRAMAAFERRRAKEQAREQEQALRRWRDAQAATFER